MFIYTARLNRKRLIGSAAAFLLLCIAVLTASSAGSDSAVNAAAPSPPSIKVKTNDDRIAYLEHYGWQVDPEPVSVEEMLIPETFDDSYADYLALQQAQGFDLSEYCGKRVKRCTYQITNYPTGESEVQVSILIYKNKVIGGEVLSPQLNGFLHGLAMPT